MIANIAIISKNYCPTSQLDAGFFGVILWRSAEINELFRANDDLGKILKKNRPALPVVPDK